MYIKLLPYQQVLRIICLLACALSAFSVIKSTEKPDSPQPQPIPFSILGHLNNILPSFPTVVNGIIAEYDSETRCSFLPIRGKIFGESESNRRDFRQVYLITVNPRTSLPLVYSVRLSYSKDYQHDSDYQDSWCALPNTWNREEIATFICSTSKRKFWQRTDEVWTLNQKPPAFKTLDSFEFAREVIELGSASITHSTNVLFQDLNQFYITLRSNTDPSVAEIAQDSSFVLVDITPQQFFQAWQTLGQHLKKMKKTTSGGLDSSLSRTLQCYKKYKNTIETCTKVQEGQTAVIEHKKPRRKQR